MTNQDIIKTRIEIIVENTAGKRYIYGSHGLAIKINTIREDGTETNILFDTGPEPEILKHNLAVLETNLKDIDAIVLSHGHWDHTGGLLEAIKMTKKRIPVICHPDAFNVKLSLKPKIRYSGIPYTINEVKEYAQPILIRNQIEIAPNIIATGEIPRRTTFEKIKGLKTIINRELTDDQMRDDQAIIIKMKDGIIVISGCAHAGIINTIKRAIEITKKEEIKAVIGGFHLIGAQDTRIDKTVEELMKMNIKRVMPGHCTGEKAMIKMANNLKNRYRRIMAGDTITFT